MYKNTFIRVCQLFCQVIQVTKGVIGFWFGIMVVQKTIFKKGYCQREKSRNFNAIIILILEKIKTNLKKIPIN